MRKACSAAPIPNKAQVPGRNCAAALSTGLPAPLVEQPPRGASCRSEKPLREVLGEMLVHLEHRHGLLPEDRFELVVGQDLTLVLRVLKIVALDGVPDPAD